MRIIGGTHKGRIIKAPGSLPVRPTTDFAKEGLFNVLNNRIDFEDLQVLDLFCGTGNISFEFASRGAKEVISVDQDFGCCNFVRRTTVLLNLPSIQVVKSESLAFLKHCKNSFDLIFADPPFTWKSYALLPPLIMEQGILRPNGILIIEHPSEQNELFANDPHFKERRSYGKINFSIFGI